MTPEQFTWWLQGYTEVATTRTAPTAEEWQIIKDHLALVFNKVTPSYLSPTVLPSPVVPSPPDLDKLAKLGLLWGKNETDVRLCSSFPPYDKDADNSLPPPVSKMKIGKF